MVKNNEYIIDEVKNRAFIIITNVKNEEKRVAIDLEDIEKAKQYKWRIGSGDIVVSDIYINGARKIIALARVIYSNELKDGEMVCYRGKNHLNCRKHNIYIKKPIMRGKIGKNTKICSVEGCGYKVIAKGLCSRHYSKERRKNMK